MPALPSALLQRASAFTQAGTPEENAIRGVTQARKWMLWWKENRGRGRAEWLFGGLTAEDREVRAAAAAELTRVAAPPVTYSPDQTAEQRGQAARAWASWFTRSGYRL